MTNSEGRLTNTFGPKAAKITAPYTSITPTLHCSSRLRLPAYVLTTARQASTITSAEISSSQRLNVPSIDTASIIRKRFAPVRVLVLHSLPPELRPRRTGREYQDCRACAARRARRAKCGVVDRNGPRPPAARNNRCCGFSLRRRRASHDRDRRCRSGRRRRASV
jgi:hypothetical protein